MKKLIISISSSILMVLLSGCSNKATYDNIQLNKRAECVKVHHAEYEECVKRTRVSYETYEQQRQDVLDKK